MIHILSRLVCCNLRYDVAFYFILLSIAILLIGCAATPYQPLNNSAPAGGYQEVKLDNNSYMLEFSGNGYSRLDTIVEFWNRRAMELCPGGYEVLDQEQNISRSAIQSESPFLPIPWTTKIDFPFVTGKIRCESE